MQPAPGWVTAKPILGPGAKSVQGSELNVARRKGVNVETHKKFTGGRNAGAHGGPPNAAKIDADETTKVPRVNPTFAQELQKARMAKKMTQADLAKAINEKPSVVNDYEGGRAIPNGAIISKMQKVLGAKLPKATDKSKPKADE
eukprot:Gregarina_sp_Poly_1__3435@NODE_199_length_11565_cov_209_900244_g178_i0_p9_GENE_NODE_199_length_11565_cov_209_900244_g178_i0NODE_199_length_11565_cov_209_900244_g178_i0_p9_ORF_typecomplete_len144_score24_28HTH_3/PF01381_22/1_4e09MBF1/PF08523_10/1_3e09MBF1/PF08523_10/5_2e02HTH_19/PF12844_7/8e07HTH_31/PF13560_6/4_5e03HTH_31/PF13560_6/1_2e05HTH_37/PF13744_6/0_00038MqsA_antitoxin/PF15731_5/0_00045HTH_26/PF13443_6/9_9e03HTH_26/PF13443_6/0_054HTH_25/PF13413_6/0_076Phage_CI_repr/PF07022_13/4_9e03Phage_C